MAAQEQAPTHVGLTKSNCTESVYLGTFVRTDRESEYARHFSSESDDFRRALQEWYPLLPEGPRNRVEQLQPTWFDAVEVVHHTSVENALRILTSGGFLSREKKIGGKEGTPRVNLGHLSWWGFKFADEDIERKREEELQLLFDVAAADLCRDRDEPPADPNAAIRALDKELGTQRERPLAEACMSCTSPAFEGPSRYGNVVFSVQLDQLLESYKTSLDLQEDPDFWRLGTFTYTKEQMHVLLVAPAAQDLARLLDNTESTIADVVGHELEPAADDRFFRGFVRNEAGEAQEEPRPQVGLMHTNMEVKLFGGQRKPTKFGGILRMHRHCTCANWDHPAVVFWMPDDNRLLELPAHPATKLATVKRYCGRRYLGDQTAYETANDAEEALKHATRLFKVFMGSQFPALGRDILAQPRHVNRAVDDDSD